MLPRLAASVEISNSMWFRISRPLDAAFSITLASTVPLTAIVTITPTLQQLQVKDKTCEVELKR